MELRLSEGDVMVFVELGAGERSRCPQCASVFPGNDTLERRWRHLDTIGSGSPSNPPVASSCATPRSPCGDRGALDYGLNSATIDEFIVW